VKCTYDNVPHSGDGRRPYKTQTFDFSVNQVRASRLATAFGHRDGFHAKSLTMIEYFSIVVN